MSLIALYYPWTHFQDDSWLKLALLTWDRIVRMRPEVMPDNDQELVRQLRAETDFIVEAAPSVTVRARVAELFLEILRDAPNHALDNYRLYRKAHWVGLRDGADAWRGYRPPRSQKIVGLDTAPPGAAWVYAGGRDSKMAADLAEFLWTARLAETESGMGEDSSGLWVGMHPKLGSIYLAVLTDVMASSEMLAPATDDPRMHSALGAADRLTGLLFESETPTPAIEHAQSAYAHVALRAVIEPDNLAEIPVAKLIRFRETHRAELAAFQDHIAGLATEWQAIAQIESPQVAAAHFRSLYETRTLPQLTELRRALRGQGVESSAGTLVQKIDLGAAAGTVLGSIAAAGEQVAVASAAVAIAVVPFLAGKARARRQQMKNSPVAYLLAADRELSKHASFVASLLQHRRG